MYARNRCCTHRVCQSWWLKLKCFGPNLKSMWTLLRESWGDYGKKSPEPPPSMLDQVLKLANFVSTWMYFDWELDKTPPTENLSRSLYVIDVCPVLAHFKEKRAKTSVSMYRTECVKWFSHVIRKLLLNLWLKN